MQPQWSKRSAQNSHNICKEVATMALQYERKMVMQTQWSKRSAQNSHNICKEVATMALKYERKMVMQTQWSARNISEKVTTIALHTPRGC